MGGGDVVTKAWETAGSRAAGTSSTGPDAGTSGASGAMGADSSRRCSSWPREDDRAGEVRVLAPPFLAEEGAVTVPSFLFFAAGSGLGSQRRKSGSSDKSENKMEVEHLLIHRDILPLRKPEA